MLKYFSPVVIVLAASFVIRRCRSAIFSSSDRLKTLETITTVNERRRAPQKARIIVIKRPGGETGDISPYPIVVRVITVNQHALKYESKTGYPIDLK